MHRGAPTRVVVGSAARSAAASSAARSASRTRCRGACVKMQRQVTRGEWKFGFRAGRRDDADEHAVELGEQLRRHLDGAGRPVAVRDQHLDRVRIFVRAAAGLEVVRGAGYIPDDFEAPDRRRDEAPARQLPPAWSIA